MLRAEVEEGIAVLCEACSGRRGGCDMRVRKEVGRVNGSSLSLFGMRKNHNWSRNL